jgi:hypothetical protein
MKELQVNAMAFIFEQSSSIRAKEEAYFPSQKSHGKSLLPKLVLKTTCKSRSSGLPSFFSAFPRWQSQWHTRERVFSADGGGSAPDFNGIPY